MPEPVDLVVPNIAEFNQRHPTLRLEPAVQRGFATIGNTLAEQAVFWSDRPRVLVLPAGHDPLWFNDVHTLVGLDRPVVISPLPRTGRLIEDLLHDGGALAALRLALDGRDTRLLCWGATPGVYQLAATVRGWGQPVELDGPAERDYWSSLYLDSKLSCADLDLRLPAMAVPRGFTVTCWDELAGAVRSVLASGSDAIVKSCHGVGGDGSIVVRRDNPALDGFWLAVSRDPFLRTFPLMVQPYLAHADGVDCPALDLRVTDDGPAELTVSAVAIEVNRFRGVSVGPGSVPGHLLEPLRQLGTSIGSAAMELGYRGWLCVDCLLDDTGALHVTECNARRSGAMHSIALLARWAGGPSGELVTYCEDNVAVRAASGRADYRNDIRPIFQRLWTRGVMAIPTSVRGLSRARQEIAVLTAAENTKAATALMGEIRTAAAEGPH